MSLPALPHAPHTDSLWRGLLCSAPIVITFLGLGAAAGAVGAGVGLSAAEIGLLCLVLYAGSAQFVFYGLFLGPLPALVATVFFINIRHLMYSFSMALLAQRIALGWRILIGAQLVDESFLIASAKLGGRQIAAARWMIGLNLGAYGAWFAGNMLGAAFAGRLDLSVFGIDFALKAMFLGLLLQQIAGTRAGRQAVCMAAACGACSLAAHATGYGHLAIIVIVPLLAALGVKLLGILPQDRRQASELSAPRAGGQAPSPA